MIKSPCPPRRLLIPLVALSCMALTAGQPPELPESSISYRIEVRIDPATRDLSGREVIHWLNRSEEIIDRVPMHLYLNAFANEASSWLSEAGTFGVGRFDLSEFYRVFPDPWGWCEPSSILQRIPGEAGEPRSVELEWLPIQPDDGNSTDRTLIQVQLAQPLAPGDELVLEIDFGGRLPSPFARTGCTEDFCVVGQWFPKIGMLELPGTRGASKARWAARQFHASTEFYAEFADFDVSMDIPEGWSIGSSGKAAEPMGEAEAGFTRHRFVQPAVHDFAFAIGEDFEEVVELHDPDGPGAPVEVHFLMPARVAHQIDRWRPAVLTGLDVLGRHVGPYPYQTLTVVVPTYKASRTNGMEYPTFFLSSTGGGRLDSWPHSHLRRAEATAIHEFCHQYFYGLLGSNEQEDAILDEGLTDYWEHRVSRELFGEAATLGTVYSRPGSTSEIFRLGLGSMNDKIREPLDHQPSALYEAGTYAMQVYGRMGMTLKTAEGLFGTEAVDRAFAAYYRDHAFGHPGVEDLIAAAHEGGGPEMAAFLREAVSQQRQPDFQVESLDSRLVSEPRGHFIDSGALPATRSEGELDDAIWMEVTDPGWSRGGLRSRGSVSWQPFAVSTSASDSPEEQSLTPSQQDAQEPSATWHSSVKLSGPGWDHLPVEVLLRFEDGTEARELWDGKSPWRSYQVTGESRLVEVRLDPEDKIKIDGKPANNGLRLEGDRRLTSDWSQWLAAVAQWVAGGVSQWL